jgi:sugar/nucleoside kinase (ribokinase family)
VTSRNLDIVAIGDAIVDVIAACDDEFLTRHDLRKGSMRLLEPEAADRLYDSMGPARETSGGSAANSMAGFAAMGGRAAFIGQVADDQLGAIFAHDIQALGVAFDTPPISVGLPTGRCLILVTPDAQRTMNTCPGAAHQLAPGALDEAVIKEAAILFLEGYCWGPELPRRTMVRAVEIAHAAGTKVALTVSDSVGLGGRRESLRAMIEHGGVDFLFANEDEAMLLAGTEDLDTAIAALRPKIPTLVVTRGPAGALAVEDGRRTDVPAAPVGQVIDTTGAGDLFAAGFLAARCKGQGIKRQLMTGAIAAAEVISHFGARPVADLKLLVKL